MLNGKATIIHSLIHSFIEVKSEMPNITNTATTTTGLTAVENKIPNSSNLVKENDYNTKINETERKITDHDHDKYLTTPEFNELTSENFAASLAQEIQQAKVVLLIS